jgi:phage FluMu protein Com
MKRGRKNRMAAMVKKYSCKNCGSVFEPSLKAEFEHIKVRCPFCHYEAALVSIPEFETPEQWEKRTGRNCPDRTPVYVHFRFKNGRSKEKVYYWGLYEWHQARRFVANIIICGAVAGPPPDEWEPRGNNEKPKNL